MKAKKILQAFRITAIAEGISFLVLLLIAMPLKYFMEMPLAVTVVGYIHGFLFIAFLMLALRVKESLGKNMAWLLKAFVASLLPFGTFIFDRSLRRDERSLVIT